MTLTIDQIKDLAEFAGPVVIGDVTDDDKETEITINACPKKGIQDGDGSIIHCRHIAYMEEYPEEGVAPLGPTNGHGREPVPELCTLPVHVDLDWLNTGGSHGLKHDIELPQLRRILEKLLDEPTVESITTTKRP